MKSIDSDFEDLEPAKTSEVASTQPQSEVIKPQSEPVVEPIVEPVVEPVVEQVVEAVIEEVKQPIMDVTVSSDEECMEQEITCWKCNGSKQNKRGRPCRKCEGTGFIRSNELAALLPIVRDEVREYCRASFTSLLEDHLKTKKEKQAQVEHPKHECDGCGVHPIMGIRYKCTVRHDYDLCEKCEAKGVNAENPMLKIRKAENAPVSVICQYKDKTSKNVSNATDLIGQKFAEHLKEPIP